MLDTKVSRSLVALVPKHGQAPSGGLNKEPSNHCHNSLGHSLNFFCTVLHSVKGVDQTDKSEEYNQL